MREEVGDCFDDVVYGIVEGFDYVEEVVDEVFDDLCIEVELVDFCEFVLDCGDDLWDYCDDLWDCFD